MIVITDKRIIVEKIIFGTFGVFVSKHSTTYEINSGKICSTGIKIACYIFCSNGVRTFIV